MFFKIVPLSVCLPLFFGLCLLFLLPLVFRFVKRFFLLFWPRSFKCVASMAFGSALRPRFGRSGASFGRGLNRFSRKV